MERHRSQTTTTQHYQSKATTHTFSKHTSTTLSSRAYVLLGDCHVTCWVLSRSAKYFHTEKSSKVTIEPVLGISNNVLCATSKASDQPAHTRSLIRAFASRLSIL